MDSAAAAVGLPAASEDEGKDESHGESTATVLVALAANGLIAAAKSVAALLIGSATVNTPGGYGRDICVWSPFAAFGLATAGASVAFVLEGRFSSRTRARHSSSSSWPSTSPGTRSSRPARWGCRVWRSG